MKFNIGDLIYCCDDDGEWHVGMITKMCLDIFLDKTKEIEIMFPTVSKMNKIHDKWTFFNSYYSDYRARNLYIIEDDLNYLIEKVDKSFKLFPAKKHE